MMNLKISLIKLFHPATREHRERSSRRMTAIPKLLVAIFLIASLLGFLDTTYLAVKHYAGTSLNCSVLFGDCEKVTTSKYSMVAGVPLALIGAIYYFTIFILSVAYLDTKHKKIIIIASYLTATGFLASVYFVFLQLFIIKAICPYCMVSAMLSTVLFINGIIMLKLKEKTLD